MKSQKSVVRSQKSEVSYQLSVKKLLTFNFSLLTFLFAVYCLLPTVSYAATVDDVVKRIEEKNKKIQDIQGDFTQTSYIKDLEKVEKYTGRFFISRKIGTKMRWAYAKPRDEEIIITGTDIWIYKKAEKQALKSKFSENSYGQTPIALLGSLENLKKNFDINMVKEGVLELKPKSSAGIIKKILLEVSTGDFPIKALSFIDIHGNKIDVVVKDVKINQGLEESFFIFKAPPGVEIYEY